MVFTLSPLFGLHTHMGRSLHSTGHQVSCFCNVVLALLLLDGSVTHCLEKWTGPSICWVVEAAHMTRDKSHVQVQQMSVF